MDQYALLWNSSNMNAYIDGVYCYCLRDTSKSCGLCCLCFCDNLFGLNVRLVILIWRRANLCI